MEGCTCRERQGSFLGWEGSFLLRQGRERECEWGGGGEDEDEELRLFQEELRRAEAEAEAAKRGKRRRKKGQGQEQGQGGGQGQAEQGEGRKRRGERGEEEEEEEEEGEEGVELEEEDGAGSGAASAGGADVAGSRGGVADVAGGPSEGEEFEDDDGTRYRWSTRLRAWVPLVTPSRAPLLPLDPCRAPALVQRNLGCDYLLSSFLLSKVHTPIGALLWQGEDNVPALPEAYNTQIQRQEHLQHAPTNSAGTTANTNSSAVGTKASDAAYDPTAMTYEEGRGHAFIRRGHSGLCPSSRRGPQGRGEGGGGRGRRGEGGGRWGEMEGGEGEGKGGKMRRGRGKRKRGKGRTGATEPRGGRQRRRGGGKEGEGKEGEGEGGRGEGGGRQGQGRLPARGLVRPEGEHECVRHWAPE